MIAETKTTRVDIRQGAAHLVLRAPLATMDNMAHVFEAQVYDGDTAADLSGATCEADFIRADGVTVMLDGTVSGSTASVTLGANCYAVPGRFELAVKLTQGDTVHTILRAEGSVTTSRTDAMTGAGSGVHSFDQLEETLERLDDEVQNNRDSLSGLSTAVQRRDRVWNLLDNSDFGNPVNQRNNTTYTGNGSYTVDRWYIDAANSSATINSDHLTMKTVSGSAYATIAQKVANASKLAGKTLTFAARVYSNVVPGIRVYRGSNSIVTVNGSAAKNSVLVCSFTVPDGIADGELIVKILSQSTQANDYVSIYWAALYEGEYTAETLPAYVPKGCAVELLECQRYYQTVSTQTSALIVSTTNRAYICNFRQSMRATPTVTVTTLTEYDNWTQTGATSSVNNVTTDYTRIYATSNVSHTGVGYWAAITVAASADL